jgi:hypothetical protein
MSYAPTVLTELRDYAIHTLGCHADDIGIVGNAAHTSGYHLGWDRLEAQAGWGDYSARLQRDRTALRGPTRNAACAFDIARTSRDHDLWVRRLVADCKSGADYTLGIRAIDALMDGQTLRWDRQANWRAEPADASHRWHTHVEWYRDVIARGASQLAILTRFYSSHVLKRIPIGQDPMSIRAPAVRSEWAALVRHWYHDPPTDLAQLRAAGEQLRAANRWRGAAPGSGRWQLVPPGAIVSVPLELHW